MASHILVTGGAGFIGSHLTRRLLARGDRVTVLDDFNDFYDPARKRDNVAPLLGRSRGYRARRGGHPRRGAGRPPVRREDSFDAVVHLAARAGVRPSLREPILYEDVNCIGTLRLLEAARRHGPQTLRLRLLVVGLRHQREGARSPRTTRSTSRSAPTPPPSAPASCSATTTITSTASASPACASSPSTARRSGRRWRSTSSPT